MRRRALLIGCPVAGLAAVGAAYSLSRANIDGDGVKLAAAAVPAQLVGELPPARVALAALDRPPGQEDTAGTVRQLARAIQADGAETSTGLALGASLFNNAGHRPRHLGEMPTFAGDVLDQAQSHGDALIQAEGNTAVAVRAAVERVLEAAPGWRVRWQIDGFRAENRVEKGRGLARNPFHFTEGFGNPSSEREIADRALVQATQGEPDWAVGGSYQVVRIVRLATEMWDKDSINEQERIIGRRRDGRWLDGTPRDEEPNFAADPKGKSTPLDSHVRRAAPDRRRPPPLVRRSYSYDRGDGDIGLIFSCFQRDLAEGFEAAQKRLVGEAMTQYLLTIGGGYYFVPPPGNAWIEQFTA